MNLFELQNNFHERILSGRSIELILKSEQFEELYHDSTEEESKDLEQILLEMSKPKLKKWILNHSKLPLLDLPLRKLHILGAQLGISYYAQMSKIELTTEIERVRNARDAKSRDVKGIGDKTQQDGTSLAEDGDSQTVSNPRGS